MKERKKRNRKLQDERELTNRFGFNFQTVHLIYGHITLRTIVCLNKSAQKNRKKYCLKERGKPEESKRDEKEMQYYFVNSGKFE